LGIVECGLKNGTSVQNKANLPDKTRKASLGTPCGVTTNEVCETKPIWPSKQRRHAGLGRRGGDAKQSQFGTRGPGLRIGDCGMRIEEWDKRAKQSQFRRRSLRHSTVSR
jgi:hypothetical protein